MPPKGDRHQTLVCQVDGCGVDLGTLREYHQRYKICEVHLKADSILKDGVQQRFCQQCGRFHELTAFDDHKRSCRERLQKHNARRRRKGAEVAGGQDPAAAAAAAAAATAQQNSGGRGSGAGGAGAVQGNSAGSRESPHSSAGTGQHGSGAVGAGAGGAGQGSLHRPAGLEPFDPNSAAADGAVGGTTSKRQKTPGARLLTSLSGVSDASESDINSILASHESLELSLAAAAAAAGGGGPGSWNGGRHSHPQLQPFATAAGAAPAGAGTSNGGAAGGDRTSPGTGAAGGAGAGNASRQRAMHGGGKEAARLRNRLVGRSASHSSLLPRRPSTKISADHGSSLQHGAQTLSRQGSLNSKDFMHAAGSAMAAGLASSGPLSGPPGLSHSGPMLGLGGAPGVLEAGQGLAGQGLAGQGLSVAQFMLGGPAMGLARRPSRLHHAALDAASAGAGGAHPFSGPLSGSSVGSGLGAGLGALSGLNSPSDGGAFLFRSMPNGIPLGSMNGGAGAGTISPTCPSPSSLQSRLSNANIHFAALDLNAPGAGSSPANSLGFSAQGLGGPNGAGPGTSALSLASALRPSGPSLGHGGPLAAVQALQMGAGPGSRPLSSSGSLPLTGQPAGVPNGIGMGPPGAPGGGGGPGGPPSMQVQGGGGARSIESLELEALWQSLQEPALKSSPSGSQGQDNGVAGAAGSAAANAAAVAGAMGAQGAGGGGGHGTAGAQLQQQQSGPRGSGSTGTFAAAAAAAAAQAGVPSLEAALMHTKQRSMAALMALHKQLPGAVPPMLGQGQVGPNSGSASSGLPLPRGASPACAADLVAAVAGGPPQHGSSLNGGTGQAVLDLSRMPGPTGSGPGPQQPGLQGANGGNALQGFVKEQQAASEPGQWPVAGGMQQQGQAQQGQQQHLQPHQPPSLPSVDPVSLSLGIQPMSLGSDVPLPRINGGRLSDEGTASIAHLEALGFPMIPDNGFGSLIFGESMDDLPSLNLPAMQ